MKLTIPASSLYRQIASFNGQASTSTMANLFEAFGKNAIHVVLRLEAMQEAVWAFSLQGETLTFDDCYANIDIGPSGHVTVYHAPRHSPEIIDVASIEEAKTLLEARHGEKMIREDGGKRFRLKSSGEWITCGTMAPFSDEQIAESRPILYAFRSNKHRGYLGLVTES